MREADSLVRERHATGQRRAMLHLVNLYTIHTDIRSTNIGGACGGGRDGAQADALVPKRHAAGHGGGASLSQPLYQRSNLK